MKRYRLIKLGCRGCAAKMEQVLAGLPGVTGASSSRFTRKEDPETGFYSPFVIELLLE